MPRRVGPYVLGRRIGTGGMSAVYAARQESGVGVGRLVAIKTLLTPAAQDKRTLKLFVREAVIATQLVHPNIVRTYELVRAKGRLCLAMEYVHGLSLASLLKAKREPFPLRVALQIAVDIASALHAAHELKGHDGT